MLSGDEAILSMVRDLRSWWIRQFQEAKADNGGVLLTTSMTVLPMASPSILVKDHRQGHQHGGSSYSRPGHFYTNQFSVSGTLSVCRTALVCGTRRKFGIHWLTRYTTQLRPTRWGGQVPQSVGDGVPTTSWMTSCRPRRISPYRLRRIHRPQRLCNSRLTRPVLSRLSVATSTTAAMTSSCPHSRSNIPDGSYMMSPKGVIHVYDSVPECTRTTSPTWCRDCLRGLRVRRKHRLLKPLTTWRFGPALSEMSGSFTLNDSDIDGSCPS